MRGKGKEGAKNIPSNIWQDLLQKSVRYPGFWIGVTIVTCVLLEILLMGACVRGGV